MRRSAADALQGQQVEHGIGLMIPATIEAVALAELAELAGMGAAPVGITRGETGAGLLTIALEEIDRRLRQRLEHENACHHRESGPAGVTSA